jgi:hypothetical protein
MESKPKLSLKDKRLQFPAAQLGEGWVWVNLSAGEITWVEVQWKRSEDAEWETDCFSIDTDLVTLGRFIKALTVRYNHIASELNATTKDCLLEPLHIIRQNGDKNL